MPPGHRGPPPNHRPTRSQEEALRARRMQSNGESSKLDPSRSPQRRQERRPRRNSESSVMDNERVMTEEERKARDQRRRERRQREGRDKKPSRKLDIIDQLDATSIFGTGSKFSIPAATRQAANSTSVPPRWPLRCGQPQPQQARQPSRSHAGLPQGLAQQHHRRLWPVE